MDKIKDSLRYSFWDGFFASIQFGIIEQFITPLALFLGANNFAIGWLNFIRNAFVSIVQIAVSDITKILKSRKKLITICVFIAALLWIPTFFAPFLFDAQKVWVFIVLFGITSSFNMFATPAWASLMSEYVPPNKRGRYFGWRGTVLGIIYCISLLAAGFILNYFYAISLFWGFAILIIVAAVARFISWYFLTKMYEPEWQVKSTDYFTFRQFIVRFPKGNFIRFAIFSTFLLTGVSFASPFLPVYILKELNFDYIKYTILIGAAVFTAFITQQYWGYFTDKYGNMKIIKFLSLLITFIPILWVFSRDFYYLFIIQLGSGFIWAGFNLASSNYIYDVAISTKRERCIAYFNFLCGAGLGSGALIGGMIFKYLPSLLTSSYYSLFIISGILRLCGSACINFFNKEVKEVEPVRTRMLLFDLSGMRFFGLLSKELIYRIRRRKQ